MMDTLGSAFLDLLPSMLVLSILERRGKYKKDEDKNDDLLAPMARGLAGDDRSEVRRSLKRTPSSVGANL